MSYDTSDSEKSKREWTTDTHEMRRRCIAVRQEIPQELVRSPLLDLGKGGVPDIVKTYNRVLQQFASQVRPKLVGLGGDADELWTRQLATVTVPQTTDDPTDVVIDGGEENVHGEVDVAHALRQLPTTEEDVSLQALREWRDKSAKFTVEYLARSGQRVKEERRRPLYLPVYALDRCRDQLDLCLDELGWLPDTAEKDTGATQVLK